MDIKKEIKDLKVELIELRRDFHQHPELGFKEFRTAEIVAEYLKGLGLEVKEKVAKTGVVGLLKGDKPGKTLMLRADMDALPITEKNEIEYKSQKEGVMHACGHDGHTAMLMVAAKILARHKDKINGNLKFVFQPNEETAGAKMMIEEGVLEDPKVDGAFGIHLWTPIESGKIAISRGAVMGGLYEFELKITGKGGHTSAPHTAVDPIVVASSIIQNVQAIQTREIDPLKPTLIMFGQINGGTATNIIPEETTLRGTIRYLYRDLLENEERPRERFERIIENTCKSYRADYEIKYIVESPPVYNNDRMVDYVFETAKEVLNNSKDIVNYTNLAGEDFGEFSDKVPSTFYFIGTGNKDKETDYAHHHPRFNIDEETLITGVEMHVRSALNFLSK
ncbi:MAG: amidohydrolase [Halanaerobiales bacterium]|nr:amidohydrolase [Halanaerobiales bacterium]